MSAAEIDDVIIATSFPGHGEICLPNDDIAVEDTNSAYTNGTVDRERLKRALQLKDEHVQYAQIPVHVDKPKSPSNKPTSPRSPKSPTSIYTVGGSKKKPKLELKDREVSTRECKFEMGEEWEHFQAIHTNKSISCPPSPLVGRKQNEVNASLENPGYAASEPGAEIDQDLTDASGKAKDPFPFHFLFKPASTTVIKEHHIVPNPNNKINHRFHSTLQCPCFLFFFFLCCLPAVHFMQQSDRQFTNGNNRRARNYGKASTIFFIIGFIIGVAFLSVAIYFAADYVRQFV